MEPTEDCYAIIKQYEGLELFAYPDPGTGGRPWTIGYGHTRGVMPGDTCTIDQAEAWLVEDVAEASAAVNNYVKTDITQAMHDALVSFVYNVGVGNFNRSNLLIKINKWNVLGAANELLLWNKASGKVLLGLTRRRKQERTLFLTGRPEQ